MRIGHPNPVLFWGPTKMERWRTYTKKWLQRYTNGLHLEADAAPLTTLQRRDMFWKILLKAWELITNSGSCFIHLKTHDIQFFSVQVCKRPKLKCNYFSISSLSIAFSVHVFKTMCYIHTKKNLCKDRPDVIKNSRMLWESPVNKQIASVNRTLSLTARRLNNQAAAARTPVMPGCHSRLYHHYYKYVWGTRSTGSSWRFGKALLKSRDGNEERMKEKISNRKKKNLLCLPNLPKSTSSHYKNKEYSRAIGFLEEV